MNIIKNRSIKPKSKVGGTIYLDPVTDSVKAKEQNKEAKIEMEKQAVEDYETCKAQLIEFNNDNSILDNYKSYEFSGDMVLVKQFKPILKELDEEGKTKSGLYLPGVIQFSTPYFKVIALGAKVSEETKEFYTPGTLAIVSDSLTISKDNPEYQRVVEANNVRLSGIDGPMKPRNLPDLDKIPARIDGFYEWIKLLFVQDKLKVSKDDTSVFLIPTSFLIGKKVKL